MGRPADRHVKIELLRAAEAAFAEHGLAAAKVEDITARAGVSKGAFYLHFETKEDAWKQIVEGFLAKLADCIEPPPESGEGPETASEVLARWHSHDLEILEFCWQNRALMKILMSGGGGAPYSYLVDEFSERARKLSEGWIRHGVAGGLYRDDVDPELVATIISGAYDRVVRDLVKQAKRPNIGAWARQLLDVFTRGLFTREAQEALEQQNERTAGRGKQRRAR